tara:strand:- start:436 stop:618 length:183 start_codon:yes stop_codon:yes gene_type:complete
MKGLPTSRLMELKTTLQILADENLMEESEMINILNIAGLSRITNSDKWIDNSGSVYTFPK